MFGENFGGEVFGEVFAEFEEGVDFFTEPAGAEAFGFVIDWGDNAIVELLAVFVADFVGRTLEAGAVHGDCCFACEDEVFVAREEFGEVGLVEPDDFDRAAVVFENAAGDFFAGARIGLEKAGELAAKGVLLPYSDVGYFGEAG